jgi:phage terminase small subunit
VSELIEKLDPNQDILRNPDQYKPKRRQMKFTPKQERFIQLFVYHDLTNTECAHRAGYAFPSVAATKMLNDPRYTHIQTKIQELKELEQKKYEITFEKVARDLQKIRDAAMEDGTYGAAVQAELGRAKLAGLMIDKKEIKTGRIDQMDRSEVEARLMALLEKNDLAPKAVDDEAEVDAEDLEEDFEDAEWDVIEDEEEDDEDDWEDEDLPDDLEDETEGEG